MATGTDVALAARRLEWCQMFREHWRVGMVRADESGGIIAQDPVILFMHEL